MQKKKKKTIETLIQEVQFQTFLIATHVGSILIYALFRMFFN